MHFIPPMDTKVKWDTAAVPPINTLIGGGRDRSLFENIFMGTDERNFKSVWTQKKNIHYIWES